MEVLDIDINLLKQKVESTLSNYSKKRYDLEILEDHQKGKYTVESDSLKLTIELKKDWVGYILDIKKGVLGKKIGTFLDTDNYPIAGEYAEVTLEIFREVMSCLESVLNNTIYVGKEARKIYLAFPIGEKTYKLITRESFFSGSRRNIDEEELASKLRLQNISELI